MIDIRSDVDQWLSSDKTNEEKISIIKNDKVLATKVTIWTNIFTEIGISYKNGIIKKKLTREIFYPMIPRYWNKLEFYIEFERENGNEIGYNFEFITKEILANRK